MKLYDRLYYTFYRLLLKLDDMFSMQRETPRAETALILSILTGFNVVTVLALLTEFMGMPVFSTRKNLYHANVVSGCFCQSTINIL